MQALVSQIHGNNELLAFCAAVGSASYVALTSYSSFASDLPTLTFILVCAGNGAALLAATWILPLFRDHSGSLGTSDAGANKHLWRYALVAALSIRIGLACYDVSEDQCNAASFAPLVPFVVSLYAYVASRYPVDESDTAYVSIDEQRSLRGAMPLRRVACIFTCSVISCIVLTLASGPRSTYICASTGFSHILVPCVQILNVFLDSFLVVIADRIFAQTYSNQKLVLPNPHRFLGYSLLMVSAILTVAGLLAYLFHRPSRIWMIDISQSYILSTLKLSIAVLITLVCMLHVVSYIGALNGTLVIISVWTCIVAICWLWKDPFGLPSLSFLSIPLATALLPLFTLYSIVLDTHPDTAQFCAWLSKALTSRHLISAQIILVVTVLSIFASRSRAIGTVHPIPALIEGANLRHQRWVEQSSTSSSLAEATVAYRLRTGIAPPPNFDKWYEYAVSRSSAIIDDFDQLDSDLLPFWSLSPAELRSRTAWLISKPETGSGGLQIRSGKITIDEQVPGSHRWMLEGVKKMINKFSQWIPDMDLSFNLGDECVVSISAEDRNVARQMATPRISQANITSHTFSEDRKGQWTIPSDDMSSKFIFRKDAWRTAFDSYAAASCHPNSKALSTRKRRSQLCIECSSPHTEHLFVKNWTLSKSPCHQPDLEHLHGLYLAAASFRGTNDLMPMFSQSRAGGFNDILYPSAWNYLNNTKYAPSTEYPDPSFSEKEPTLFWRGSTSEGLSRGRGQWKGMSRQRLVHLLNNGTAHEEQLVAVPASSESKVVKSWSWRYVSLSTLYKQFNTSVRFTGKDIARCGRSDCLDQKIEFAPEAVDRVPFQTHWRYKYLIDMDGAGFSGRYIPFLHSKSLVFKSALVREWHEDRLTAWKHFVPVDLRLAEIWSLLGFFAGWKKIEDGIVYDEWVSPPHDDEAEKIALEGKEWADKVLRAEDMEIYMFRLLLEWARLTDDNRDHIGFE